jgi:hypothetical protein
MKHLAIICILYVVVGYAVVLPPDQPSPARRGLTLVLEGTGVEQAWVLKEENFPAGLSRTELILPPTHGSNSSLLARADPPDCDYINNRAPRTDCIPLLNALFQDFGPLPQSPRSIRYNNCYVSWRAPASGYRVFLWPNALNTFNACNLNDHVSGLQGNVVINGANVIRQCLSSRPNHC